MIVLWEAKLELLALTDDEMSRSLNMGERRVARLVICHRAQPFER